MPVGRHRFSRELDLDMLLFPKFGNLSNISYVPDSSRNGFERI